MSEEKILVCSIGTAGHYNEVDYRLGDRAHCTRFAPVAVARLLDLKGARALVLVTGEARKAWYEVLAAELMHAGLIPEPVDIPLGRDEKEILQVFSTLADLVPHGARVTLDVSFGLRHLPFVYLATLAYCSGLHDAALEGVYSGAYELRSDDGTVPVVEVTALVHLLDWYHGLRAFRETGDLSGVVARLDSLSRTLFGAGKRPADLGRVKDAAARLGPVLAAGLPIEAGAEACRLTRAAAALSGESLPPAAHKAVASLADAVRPWALPGPSGPPKGKAELPMDRAELQRELRLARWYLAHGRVPVALSILREWIVNAMIVASGDPSRWYDYGARRKPVEIDLNAAQARAEAGVADERERALSGLWRSIADRRNDLMHSGMSEHWLQPNRGTVEALLERCEREGANLLRPAAPAGGILLITPLGLSPGVLYSALDHEHPDELVIITSAAARSRIPEALARSGTAITDPLVIELSEPYAGFREIDTHIDEDLRRRLVSAGTVVVNLTGGTTVMQYAAERLAAEAAKLGMPVRRVAMVDRRDPEEQRREPWVVGERVDLNGTGRES